MDAQQHVFCGGFVWDCYRGGRCHAPFMSMLEDGDRHDARDRMVQEQIMARGIHDARVLAAMRQVPRHSFIPANTDAWKRAYDDGAQPIGEGQTISQPYIVALM